jgi:hypothetical protein
MKKEEQEGEEEEEEGEDSIKKRKANPIFADGDF